MPELGTLTGARAASLAGLAPVTREPGSWKGRSFIQGGRHQVRRLLYMPAVVAIRYNPDLKAEVRGSRGQRETAQGRPYGGDAETPRPRQHSCATGPHLDSACARKILLPCLPDTLPGEQRSQLIEPSTSGLGNGGDARNAARQVFAASAGIHLTWILPSQISLREGSEKKAHKWPRKGGRFAG